MGTKKRIKESACDHPWTCQRQIEYADPDGEAPTYEVLECLDCGKQIHPEDEGCS